MKYITVGKTDSPTGGAGEDIGGRRVFQLSTRQDGRGARKIAGECLLIPQDVPRLDITMVLSRLGGLRAMRPIK